MQDKLSEQSNRKDKIVKFLSVLIINHTMRKSFF